MTKSKYATSEIIVPNATRVARQFWIQEPGRGEIVGVELPPRRDDHVRVRTLYSGISRGTESLVYRGEVPESERKSMRAPFQEGDFPGPVKYGYSSVGQVVEAPDALAAKLADRPVFCLYPHQDLYDVPVTNVHVLPDGVPPARAVLAANLETAVNVAWDARPAVGDRVVVVGAGVVGLLVAWLCGRVPGVRVTAVDPNPARERPSRELGVTFSTLPPPDAEADVVIHASGAPEGLSTALALAGVEATVIEASWYGTRPVTLPLGEGFHTRRLTLRSSQVGRIPPDRGPRWSHARRMALALELLADPRLDVLVTGESPFEELPVVLETLSTNPGDTLCYRIRYSSP